jgi:hypothetical protein
MFPPKQKFHCWASDAETAQEAALRQIGILPRRDGITSTVHASCKVFYLRMHITIWEEDQRISFSDP